MLRLSMRPVRTGHGLESASAGLFARSSAVPIAGYGMDLETARASSLSHCRP